MGDLHIPVGNSQLKRGRFVDNIQGKYALPYYYSKAYTVRMFIEDELIFILGTEINLMSGYCNCILYDERYPVTQNLYFPTFKPLDICYMPPMNAFFALSGTSVWGVSISGDGVGFKKAYNDYQIATDAGNFQGRVQADYPRK